MSFCGMYSILFDCSNIDSCHEPRKEMGALACRKSNSQTSRTTCLKRKTSQNYYSCNISMLQLHFSASFTIKLLVTQKLTPLFWNWRFCRAFFPSFGNVDLSWLHSVAMFHTSISVNIIFVAGVAAIYGGKGTYPLPALIATWQGAQGVALVTVSWNVASLAQVLLHILVLTLAYF